MAPGNDGHLGTLGKMSEADVAPRNRSGRSQEPAPVVTAERVAWALGVTLAAPVLALRYPPMADLPFHESLVALLRHFGDAAWQPPGLYVRSFGPPNQLFHFAAWALSLALPTDLACKLVAAVAVAAAPPAAARLARHFRRAEWCSFLVAPLTFGIAFHWGLVGNVVALPLLLFSLPALDRFAAHPTLRQATASVGLVALLYLAHESALVVAAFACVVFAIRRDGPLRPARLAPVALAAALAVFYAWWGRHLKAPSILATPDAFGPPFGARIAEVPEVLFATVESWHRIALLGAYVLSFAMLGAVRLRSLGAGHAATNAWARIEQYRLELIGVACAVAYFVVPFAFGGSTLLYERFLPVSCAVLCVALAPSAEAGGPRLLPFFAASISLATLCLSLPAFGGADRRFRELDALLPLIERNSAVAQLDLTPVSHGRVAPIVAAGGRVLAERGGRLLFSFTDAPTSPVVISKSHQWNEPVLRMTYDPFAFSLTHDLRFFRYVLIHLNPEWSRLEATIARAFAPEALLVGSSGEWLLFESTLETVPLTAPDATLAMTPGATLHERLSAARR
jgi:hypothetical protein